MLLVAQFTVAYLVIWQGRLFMIINESMIVTEFKFVTSDFMLLVAQFTVACILIRSLRTL
jgi:hypothetical protein